MVSREVKVSLAKEVRIARSIRFAFAAILLTTATSLLGQANGKLQIHFMDVGQGDGALLISPKGETVLFDDGVLNACDRPIAYLQQLGVTAIDYHITSHYHSDHIGCASEVLSEYPLKKAAFDRGGSYSSASYSGYKKIAGSLRRTAAPNTAITLDANSPSPIRITFVALNGNGISTTNENDLSLVCVVEAKGFRAELGGDLSGEHTGTYEDIETGVAPLVGQVDVYKVHHHCSSHSSNETWLNTVKPRIGVISTGDGNSYGHPAQDCLDRLHAADVKTYWTERGNGGTPVPPYDIVSGSVIVEYAPGATTFTVTTANGHSETFPLWSSGSATPSGPGTGTTVTTGSYAWSKLSKKYHYANCSYVSSILPTNLERGTTPPSGMQLHSGCPK